MLAAMKAGERERVGTLRLLLSELQKAAKEGRDDEQAVLRRERKRRLESERAFRDGGRGELAAQEQGEAELIATYLPEEMDEAELERIVAQAIAASGASSPADMGKVIGLAVKAADGRADGRRISEHVKRAL
ncbi:MAG: GatB/YqeY domain-containing protein [Solirubrobacteraceae bacterium]